MMMANSSKMSIAALSTPYWMSILNTSFSERSCSRRISSQLQMQSYPNRFLKKRANKKRALLTLRELLQCIISFSLPFMRWPFILSQFSQSLLLLMQIVFLSGQKLRKRNSPRLSLTISSKESEEFGSIQDSPITYYSSIQGYAQIQDYETFLLAGETQRLNLPPKSKLFQLSVFCVFIGETTSSLSCTLRFAGEGQESSLSLRKMLGISILELSSESSKEILCIWQVLVLAGFFLPPSARLTSFQQGLAILQIIFNGSKQETFGFIICIIYVIIPNYMQTSISAFLKKFSAAQGTPVSQIQKQLLIANPRLSSKKLLPLSQNIDDIKVISPFYSRPQPCTNKHCFCPYHRKLRLRQVPLKKIQNRATHFKTATNSPTKKVKTELRQVAPRLTHRSPTQRKQVLPQKKPIVWQGRKKVQSRNYEFDQFLHQFQQILLKKNKLANLDLHKIKSSVGEIFKYIYTHLDVDNQVAREYISKMEKDRDFTNFYMERFMELKERSFHKKSIYEGKESKHKTTFFQLASEKQAISRDQSRKRTRLQRKQLSKKTMRSRHHKLMAQQMLDDLECGEEIQKGQIQQFINLQIQLFAQNCDFFHKKIKHMDQDSLEELMSQVVKKAKQTLEERQVCQTNSSKIEHLNKLMGMIQNRVSQIQSGEGLSQHRSFVGPLSSHSINRGISNHQARKNKQRNSVILKGNELMFSKSGFNQLKKQSQDQEVYNGSEAEAPQKQEQQQEANVVRQSPKALTIFLQTDEQNNMSVRTGKSTRLKLGKYRKLSHDVFSHSRMLDSDQELIFSKMNIDSAQDIETQLDNLSFKFNQKKKRLRDIQCKIKEFNMRKFMINEYDSLITAKRKVRVLKSLIISEEFQIEVKMEMKQYLKIIQQQNYVKNRKWANKKIKNILKMSPEQEQVEILEGDYQEEDKFYINQVIAQIFGKSSKLVYYDLLKTTFEEKQVNFEHNDQEFLKTTIIQQKRLREVKGHKRTYIQKHKTVMNQQEQMQSVLKQMGLNNKCLSNYCLLTDHNQHQQRYQTRQLLQEGQPYQLSEDRYLGLLNKLAKLSK